MLSFYKTVGDQMQQLPASEMGCWINCIDPQDEEVSALIRNYSVEPDFFRAAMDEEESPRIDKEDNNTLIIVDIPVVESTENEKLFYSTRPLGIIITEKNVITVSLQPNPVLDEFTDGAVRNVQTNLKTRFVLQLMLRIATRFLLYLKQIERISDTMEKELRRSMKNNELVQLLDIEKSLVYFSSSLKQNEITMEKIMRGRAIKLYDEDQDLLEDVLIEVRQAIDMSNIYMNILSGTMDAFASIINNNLNNVMKVLASITLIFSLPTVISGIYGMNVSGLPLPQFWFPMVLTGVSMVIAAIILKKKRMM
ncbi:MULTISPECIES: magnesium transporter CorA family protein [Caproicibacterium]|jgi:magnesium transporter|uniref:Magnesium transporter CorA family protein n=1 Tax=Caproicibacterium lactatifermentans TaxID=2666138 RepID=A0A859DNK4_9FIRM|nr:magnesium transporter CorA family protein [Caproicibacterium lactatifermentans]ARP50692.1 magnesium transporter [Ruminococcaceae bacterium CPB6]MDD4807583.1 magnesium transporter CorA family protein [Oscillospiraceae bacterium]QKN23577.1 magnesium transporter CorA family protein [Caproicibacterium lactatifermentans]QKO29747.1 magnesium transporter CorA family protein [Caproicibacterium lactatifermentans]